MPVQPRHAISALAVAFVVGTVGGAIVLGGGDDSVAGTGIPFNPDSAAAAQATPTPTPKSATGFTALATKQGNRIVITGEGAQPGAKLVVQRKVGSDWQDFPAHATASSKGTYSTYIITSRDGTYRLKDTGSEDASDPVDVKV